MKRWFLIVSLLFETASAEAQGVQAPDGDPSADTSESIAFVAYSMIGKQQLFVLSDLGSRESSAWMKVGESWKGHVLRAYDEKNEALSVERDSKIRILRLKEERIVDNHLLPRILKGSSRVVGDMVVYSSESEVQFATKFRVSSSNGEFVFDAKANSIRGDLIVDTGEDFLVIADNGTVKFRNGRPIVSAKTLGRLALKKPNKSPEPTPTAVTPRATK